MSERTNKVARRRARIIGTECSAELSLVYLSLNQLGRRQFERAREEGTCSRAGNNNRADVAPAGPARESGASSQFLVNGPPDESRRARARTSITNRRRDLGATMIIIVAIIAVIITRLDGQLLLSLLLLLLVRFFNSRVRSTSRRPGAREGARERRGSQKDDYDDRARGSFLAFHRTGAE